MGIILSLVSRLMMNLSETELHANQHRCRLAELHGHGLGVAQGVAIASRPLVITFVECLGDDDTEYGDTSNDADNTPILTLRVTVVVGGLLEFLAQIQREFGREGVVDHDRLWGWG